MQVGQVYMTKNGYKVRVESEGLHWPRFQGDRTFLVTIMMRPTGELPYKDRTSYAGYHVNSQGGVCRQQCLGNGFSLKMSTVEWWEPLIEGEYYRTRNHSVIKVVQTNSLHAPQTLFTENTDYSVKTPCHWVTVVKGRGHRNCLNLKPSKDMLTQGNILPLEITPPFLYDMSAVIKLAYTCRQESFFSIDFRYDLTPVEHVSPPTIK